MRSKPPMPPALSVLLAPSSLPPCAAADYVNLGLTNREAVALTGGGHSIGG